MHQTAPRSSEAPLVMRCRWADRLSGYATSTVRESFCDSLQSGAIKVTGVRLRVGWAFLLLTGAFTLVASAQDRERQVSGVVLNGSGQPLAGRREEAQPATAQTAVELSGKVEAGDKIFVTDRSGVQPGGRLLRLSPEALALLVGGQERVMPLNGVGRVEKRDSLRNGMLIGAVPSALVGMAAAGASCSPHCGRDVPLGLLVVGGMGAGIGALIDFGIHGYSVIDGPPLGSPNARRVPGPVTLLDELWLRVRQGDTIEVVTLSGRKVTGKFVQVSSTFVTLVVDNEHREIPSSDVRRVTRAGNRYRSGALWGGAIFGTMGLLTNAGCSGGGCGNPLFVAMFTGSGGALWGAAIGAAIPRHPVVYDSGASPAVRAMPLIGHGRVGVAFSA